MVKFPYVAALTLIYAVCTARDLKLSSTETVEQYFPHISSAVVDAFRMAEHSVEKLVIPAERGIAVFKAGQVDVDIMRLANFNDIVPGAVPVPVVLTTMEVFAVVRADSPYFTKADLVGKRMAGQRGIRVFDAIGQHMNAHVTQLNSMLASVKMIASGRVDFMPITKDIAEQVQTEQMDLRIIEESLLTMPFYVWLTADNADLLPDIEKNLNILKAEGRF